MVLSSAVVSESGTRPAPGRTKTWPVRWSTHSFTPLETCADARRAPAAATPATITIASARLSNFLRFIRPSLLGVRPLCRLTPVAVRRPALPSSLRLLRCDCAAPRSQLIPLTAGPALVELGAGVDLAVGAGVA